MKIMAAIGALFLLVSIYFLFPTISACVQAMNDIQVDMPVSLHPGIITTSPFRTFVDYWDYQAGVEFTPKKAIAGYNPRGFPIFEWSIGPIKCVRTPFCPEFTNAVDISWELRDGGKTVAEGSSEKWNQGEQMAGDKLVIVLGMFRVKKWHRYTMVLHINRDASALNVADPRIVVRLPYSYNEPIYLGVVVSGGFTLAFGLIGLLLLYPAVKCRRGQRHLRHG